MKDKAEYIKTYFRIDAGYKWGEGMNEKDNKSFDNEIRNIFTALGFTIKEPEISNASIEVFRGAENLYCHPMNLSGEIKKESIKDIEKALKQAKTFSLRNIDTYDISLNYTPEELILELSNRVNETEEDILALFKTKRSNLYRSSSCLWDYKTKVNYFKDNLGLKNVERDFILNTFNNLIKQGKIQEGSNSRGGKIYRTITKVLLTH